MTRRRFVTALAMLGGAVMLGVRRTKLYDRIELRYVPDVPEWNFPGGWIAKVIGGPIVSVYSQSATRAMIVADQECRRIRGIA